LLRLKSRGLYQQLLRHNLILKKGPEYPDGFKLKSGKASDVYINLRGIIEYPYLIQLIINDMFNFKPFEENYTVLGIPTMGAVLAPILAFEVHEPMAVIRLNKKSHGVGAGALEGKLTEKILLIDDVITSGTSIKEVEETYIKPYFGTSKYDLRILTVIDRQDHNLKNVTSLLTLKDILKYSKEL
jgi:orotate phosphoribosyltransferase